MDGKTKLEQWDKKYIWHPFTQHYHWDKETPLIIARGKGVYLEDIRGRRFIDGVSSLWVNLLGHNHPGLNKALRSQLGKIAHSTFLGLSHEPAIKLAQRLASLTPPGLTRSFYSDNGATSVEVALKMAYQYGLQTGNKAGPRGKRDQFLALQGSYHGDTIGSVSVGGIKTFHTKFRPLLFKTHFAMAPYCYRCPFNKTGAAHRFRLGEQVSHIPKPGERREETLCRWECLRDVESIIRKKQNRLAGAIIEPLVQGANGIIVMPPGYSAGFQALCQKYGILLIVDEVATGFGRTGTLFASEQEGLRPDFLCMAKALTGGYTPLAVTMARERIFRSFWAPAHEGRTFYHGHSYTAHPLGCAVALENLRLIEKIKLLEKTRQKAHLMKDELQSLAGLPHVGSIRQAGLMAGIELVADKGTKTPYPVKRRLGAAVCREILEFGVWLRPLGDVIVLMPPPVIANHDLVYMIRSLKKVILHERDT